MKRTPKQNELQAKLNKLLAEYKNHSFGKLEATVYVGGIQIWCSDYEHYEQMFYINLDNEGCVQKLDPEMCLALGYKEVEHLAHGYFRIMKLVIKTIVNFNNK